VNRTVNEIQGFKVIKAHMIVEEPWMFVSPNNNTISDALFK